MQLDGISRTGDERTLLTNSYLCRFGDKGAPDFYREGPFADEQWKRYGAATHELQLWLREWRHGIRLAAVARWSDFELSAVMWHQSGSFTADCDRGSFQADLISLSFFVYMSRLWLECKWG